MEEETPMEKDPPTNFEQDTNLLGKILQTSVSAIMVLNTEGSIIHANEAAKKLLCLDSSEINGNTFNVPQWDITTYEGDPFPEEQLPFPRVINTKKPVYGIKHAIRWPDGSRRFLSINGAPILNEAGEIEKVVFSISDITEEKEMEEELRRSERRFRDVAEASGEYIWELDTEGKYTYVSKRLGEMLDRPVGEVIGKTPFFFMPEDEARRIEGWFTSIVKNRKPFKDLEHSSLLKDGSLIWQRVSGLPMFDNSGNYIGYRGTAADITEKKEHEAAIKESAERLEMAVAASGIGIWDLDIATGRLTWDDSMLDMYGIRREDFTSAYEAWEKALHPNDRYKAEAALQDTIHELKPFDVQFRIVRPDGETRNIHAIARVYFDEDDNPERIVGINMDITERLKSENALRENEAKLSSLYDLAPVAIILNRKSDGKFIEANPELFRLTGYSEDEYKELSYWDITPGEYAEAEKKQLEEIDKRGGYGPFEKEYIRKDGTLVPVLLQGVVIKAANGEELIWSIAQDISEQKRHERELHKAKEQAETANRAKSEFLANMSHEIRTPMNAVIGLSQLLLNTKMNRDQEDKLHKIHQSSKMLLGIINDILDFSKIESNKLKLEVLDFNLRELVVQLSTLFDEGVGKKDLELFFHISPDVPVMLKGDSLRIGQVLTNLLSNAVKFTHKGSVKLFIRRLEKSDKTARVQFEIKDTGIGMSEEQIQRLFTPFTQADTTTTRKYGGSGLGLVISSRIIEAMGGSLEVDSVPDKGTVFRFELELSLSEEEPVSDSWETLEKRKILVVDDHEDARIILEEMLESCNMQVELACDGEEGIEKVLNAEKSGGPFDFILMDWKMPGLNGIETSRKIRELSLQGELREKTPSILIISAYSSVVSEIEEIDGIDFISKPVTASSLFDSLLMLEQGEKRTADTGRRLEAPVFPGLKVLLVEDNELNQEVAYNLLAETEAKVSIANNGVEAVSLVQEHSFDMIFMDLQMPEMDGYEATRNIRRIYPKIPIIALTAAALVEDRRKAKEAGLDDHLIKPIHTGELYKTMQRYAPDRSTVRGEKVKAKENTGLPENLPGFDIPSGVEISGGDPDFYLKMLLKYQQQLNELFTSLMRQITDTQKLKEAALTVHSLKGVAANMAATPLHKAAVEAEKKIKAGYIPENTDIEALEKAFEEVSRGFALLKSFTEKNAPASGAEQETNEPEADYFQKVYSQLRAGEMLEDAEIDSLLDALKGVAGAEQRDALFKSIDNLMYDEAADLLQDILKKIEDR
ncbi:MAG: PAS domain S-box protein [Spirochaetia bacterium]